MSLLPQVMLPWAQSTWQSVATEAAVQRNIERLQRNLTQNVPQAPPGHEARLFNRDREAGGRGLRIGGGKRKQKLAPVYRPLPHVPLADRVDYAPENLVTLAVALDVLATLSRRMPADGKILGALTDALLTVSALGGNAEDVAAKLVRFALSAAGRERAALSQDLAASSQQSGITSVAAPGVSSPASVAAAAKRVEEAATIMVNDACLVIAAREGVEYRSV